MIAAIRAAGGTAAAVEADLSDPEAPACLFAAAQAELGPIDILINNATGWLADTFAARSSDQLGRNLVRVSAESFDQQFSVDARGGALLISEFARQHEAQGLTWGRIIGLTSGGPNGFPGSVVRGSQGGAGQLHHVGGLRAGRPGDHRQHRLPAGDGYRLGHG